MKTNHFRKILFALCILISMKSGYGQSSSLYVQNPQSWGKQAANIDEATLTVKPKGVYMEYGLYLTFSAKGSSWYGQANPALEIVMDFCLPEGSIIHDSWLWVGSTIMQAILIDKAIASQIYEGIVNRRKDPSILYKKSDNCYELRVYPLAGNDTRKVKITYLVPTHWTRNHVSANMPIDILRLSHSIPDLQLNVHTDQSFQNPVISEIGFLPFSGSGSPYSATIPSTAITTYSSLDISYNSPLQNGVFAGVYPINSDEGYFQLVMSPKDVLGISSPRNLAVLIEYTNGNSLAQKAELMAKIKEMLLEYLSPTDSFNLFFATPAIQQASTGWLPANDQTINSIFAFAPANISAAASLEQFILAGGNFVKNHGGGELLLITNSEQNSYYSSANQIIDNVVLQFNNQVPVNIINYTGSNNNSYYYGYYDNYLYTNLCARTGGNYVSGQIEYYYWDQWGGYYDYYQVSILSDLFHEMFSSLDEKIVNYSFNAEMDQGICYSEIALNNSNALYYNLPYKMVGKYFGQGSLNFELSAIVNSNLVSASRQISQSYISDSLLRKAWAGHYIMELENGSLTNQLKREIIDTSMGNRVLSMYTAFLALEPNDTLSACENCGDETTPGGGAVDVTEIESPETGLSASPNPFSNQVVISFTLDEKSKEKPELRIYNLMGQEVKTFTIDKTTDDTISITWYGNDHEGNSLPDGVYIAVLITSGEKQIVKIVKAGK